MVYTESRLERLVSGAPVVRDRVSAGARCTVSDVMRWSGLEGWASAADGAAQSLGLRRVLALQVLVHQQQPLRHFYVVAAGSFKSVRVDSEGFEQVQGFALRGDVIGLDGVHLGHHPCSVVALEDATVVLLDSEALLDPLHREPALARLCSHAAARELEHRSHTQYLMSAPSAEVRVARFLLSFGQRQQLQGCSPLRFRLRMSRRDIASYLGVAHETVSRALSLLGEAGYLAVDHREVAILDPVGLAQMARPTRGHSACAALKRQLRNPPLRELRAA